MFLRVPGAVHLLGAKFWLTIEKVIIHRCPKLMYGKKFRERPFRRSGNFLVSKN